MAAILSNYGYNCIWLNDDWNGADCIAMHIDGVSDIKIQLKGNISFDKKYCGKNLYIFFLRLYLKFEISAFRAPNPFLLHMTHTFWPTI